MWTRSWGVKGQNVLVSESKAQSTVLTVLPMCCNCGKCRPSLASYPITCPKRSAQLGTPEHPSAELVNSRASSDNGKLKNKTGRM